MRRPDYPDAERLDVVDDLHGHPVADPYRWLEDADDPRTKCVVGRRRRLFQQVLATWPGRDRIERE